MKRTRMLPVLVALSVPALTAAQGATPAPVRSRPQMENHDTAPLACAPDAVLIAPAMAMRVIGGYERGRMLFGPNDPLIIGAGTKQGLQSGQEYLVRRVVHDQFTPMTAASVLISLHTAGLVKVIEAREDLSIATVTQACDGVLTGDYLEPIADAVTALPARAEGQPDFAHPARLVMADERRQTGVSGGLMLIDRGSDDAVQPGQRLTVFRQADLSSIAQRGGYVPMSTVPGGGPIFHVGAATVLSVRPKTSLVRIDSARDAVYVGDMVALHK